MSKVELEALYKRTRTGAIQRWGVYAYEKEDGSAILVKFQGQLGGKLQEYNELITSGKNIGKVNETTPFQQACTQATSDWKKKKDQGYKTLKELGISLQPTSEDRKIWSVSVEPDHKDFPMTSFEEEGGLYLALDLKLPKFNSDAQGNPKPMLAKDWKKVKEIKYPVIVQPKLDGVRCLLIIDHNFGNWSDVKFLSRSGKEYNTLGHIEQDVREFLEHQEEMNIILDGEIYSDELTFQENVSAVKALKENSRKLKYHVYDIVDDRNQLQRSQILKRVVEELGSPHIEFVRTYKAISRETVLDYHDVWVKQGYEGAMIRAMDGKYEQGFRSSNLLKVKEFDETEFELLWFEYGQRGVEDLIGACRIRIRQEEFGFKAKIEGTKASKEELVKEYGVNQKFTNLKLTVKHFGWTSDGLPRFPIGKAVRDYKG